MKTFKEIATALQEQTDDNGSISVVNIENASFDIKRASTSEAMAIKETLQAVGFNCQLVLLSFLVFRIELI